MKHATQYLAKIFFAGMAVFFCWCMFIMLFPGDVQSQLVKKNITDLQGFDLVSEDKNWNTNLNRKGDKGQ